MLKKKYFFFILALIVLAGPAWAQRLTDDRELFMGVTGTNKIKPNLMVLMDNSGSMQTVIFHPSYNPNTILSEARPGDTDGIFNWNDLRLNVIKTFYINRGRINYRCEYDSYAQWDSTISSSPTRKWKVYYSNPDEYYYPTPPAIGQVISFLCNVSNSVCSCNYTATISNVAQKTEGSGSRRRYYYEITVTGTSANPNSTYPYLYLNVHKVIDTTDNSVSFSETADSNYEESIPITLYGSTQEGYSGNRYDLNYLKWLAYYATETQINEVSAWASGANQGKFPDENGVLQEAGLVRIRVARSTLQNLADDVHEDCRLGLTIFSSSNDGGQPVILHIGFLRPRILQVHHRGRCRRDLDAPRRGAGRHLEVFQGRRLLYAQHGQVHLRHRVHNACRHAHPALLPEQLRDHYHRRPVHPRSIHRLQIQLFRFQNQLESAHGP